MTKNAFCAALLVFSALFAEVRAQERALPDPEALVALLRAGKYAELDAQVGAYQAAYEANTDREWQLVSVIAGFERVDPDLEAHLSAWVQAQPRSYVARLARAAYWHQRGWSSRGGRFSAKTADIRLKAMQRYFEQSDLDLRASLQLGTRPQLSHRYLIVSGMARGERSQMQDAFEAALRADPENYASRRAFLNALRPEWGGTVAAMEQVVAHAASAGQTPKLRAVVQSLKASVLGYRALAAERAKSTPAALDFYAKGLAEAEDAILLANRGRLLLQLGRLDEAFRDLDRAATLDPTSGDALERRGNLYERRKQFKEAVQDYARAGSYGRPYAMQRLGLWYLNGGDGVAVNDAQAARWLRLGAELGDDRAQMGLGYLYSAGRGVEQDPRQAITLWRLSAAQGNQQAQKYLDDVPWWWRARFAVEDLFSR